MKILIYSPKFYPSVGGLENLTMMLAKEFVNKGEKVKIICFEKTPQTLCDLEVFYAPNFYKQLKLFFWSNILYMPNISMKGIWLMFFCPFKKLVISHNVWYGPYPSENKINILESVKFFISRFAKNISVSTAVSKYIPFETTVIPNCYDSEVFHTNYQTHRENNLLFVGRLVSDKGIVVLLNACLLLWEKGVQFKLTLVGDGEMKNWIIDFLKKNNISTKVFLVGILMGEALAIRMNENKLLVVPSIWQEPFGIVALEGLACGCKVIASNSGGLPEAAGDFGTYFDTNNVSSLSQVIEESIKDQYSPDFKLLSNHLKNHTASNVAKQYLNKFFE